MPYTFNYLRLLMQLSGRTKFEAGATVAILVALARN